VTKTRYADFAELMDYCRRSADPIGRLLLRLYGVDDPKSRSLSDGVCSSLQLINHWQDIAVDWGKGRVYLPQDELARFGIDERQIAEGRWDAAWAAMMDFQIDRARAMMAFRQSAGAAAARTHRPRAAPDRRQRLSPARQAAAGARRRLPSAAGDRPARLAADSAACGPRIAP
jgi:phytoene/squalene synthetase